MTGAFQFPAKDKHSRVIPAFLCLKYRQVLQVFFMPKMLASIAGVFYA